MLNAIIVEDEMRSRETLAGLLKLYCKKIYYCRNKNMEESPNQDIYQIYYLKSYFAQ